MVSHPSPLSSLTITSMVFATAVKTEILMESLFAFIAVEEQTV